MKSTLGVFSLSILAAVVALAHPLPRDDTPNDLDILNFSLTLEHLENTFYTQGLSRFTQKDFVDAGFPDWSYGRLKQIATHEAAHVQFLESTLGSMATKPCTYNFPYDDPKSFVALSHAIEAVGTSAYIGALKSFENKDYVLAVATILSTEARHSAWVDSAIRKGSAWSGVYDTPLDFNQAFTVASSFIVSCPPSNPNLPYTAFAELTLLDPSSAWPGSTTPLQFAIPKDLDSSTKLYGTFLTGQEALIVPLEDGGKSVSIPDTLRGVVYLLITTDMNAVEDSKTIAGPALLEFSFNSDGNLQRLPLW